MSILEIKETILNCYEFAVEKEMTDPVIRLYITGEDDIDIWNEKDYFYFSTRSFRYGSIEELLDDLCEEVEENGYAVTNIEIE